MPEEPQRDSTSSAHAARADDPLLPPLRLGLAAVAQGICVISAAIAVILLLSIPTLRATAPGAWGMQLALATIVLAFSSFAAAQQWLHWAGPARQLARLLPLVRAGKAPIEELSGVRGGMTCLVAQMQETLRNLRRQRAKISQLELEMSQRVAGRTDALERALGAVRQQASRDPLTGLFNRRMLEATLKRLIEHCREGDESLSLMMIDVDDFKLLNDTLGHAAGDEFLRSLGQLIKSTIRGNDIAFRYGGDEFVIILPATDRERAGRLSERLTSLIDGLTRPLRLPRPPRLSIGLVSIDDTPPDALLLAADKLLYDAKIARKRQQHTDAARASAPLTLDAQV